jgi:indole-3-glycerol phosphate synthase
MVGGMDSVAVVERVERIVAVRDDAAASDDLIESGLVAVREVQAWADAQHAVLVGEALC